MSPDAVTGIGTHLPPGRSRGLRILVLSNLYPPDFIGGYELGCGQVVDGLRARGHQVRVLTSAPRRPVPPQAHVRRSFRLADVYGASGPQAPDFVNAFNVYALAAALEEFRPDVAYVWNLVGLGGLGLMGCLQHVGVPWVWHLMDCVPRTLAGDGEVPPLVRDLLGRLRGRYLACSRRVVDEIEQAGIPLRGRVELLPNWVRGERPPERAEFYRGGHLRVVTAGQVGRHKGTDLLVEAAGLLRGQGHRTFSVDVYGRVADATLPRLVRRLGLEGCVTFQGPRSPDELLRIYRAHAYDVFALPTWEREPFAFAPLEAAAHGIVPLLTDDCGNAEWFVHGVDCLKARRSARAFAGVLADVLEGAIDLRPLARRAAAVVWRDFRLEALLPRIEAHLARASRRRPARAGSVAEAYCLALLAEKLLRQCDPSPHPVAAPAEEVCHAA